MKNGEGYRTAWCSSGGRRKSDARLGQRCVTVRLRNRRNKPDSNAAWRVGLISICEYPHLVTQLRQYSGIDVLFRA
jgi:hypothetical protein